MSKTRKVSPGRKSRRRPLTPYLPTATARAVTVFSPVNGAHDAPVAVEVLDYGIVMVVQVTALSPLPLAVTDLVVNGAFQPLLALGSREKPFTTIQWPREMTYGSSFRAVLQAPAGAGKAQPRCYPEQPTSITVSTGLGDFVFVAGEVILQPESLAL